jgi:hypothetical protein
LVPSKNLDFFLVSVGVGGGSTVGDAVRDLRQNVGNDKVVPGGMMPGNRNDEGGDDAGGVRAGEDWLRLALVVAVALAAVVGLTMVAVLFELLL